VPITTGCVDGVEEGIDELAVDGVEALWAVESEHGDSIRGMLGQYRGLDLFAGRRGAPDISA
jgi:hypothetical protein